MKNPSTAFFRPGVLLVQGGRPGGGTRDGGRVSPRRIIMLPGEAFCWRSCASLNRVIQGGHQLRAFAAERRRSAGVDQGFDDAACCTAADRSIAQLPRASDTALARRPALITQSPLADVAHPPNPNRIRRSPTTVNLLARLVHVGREHCKSSSPRPR